MIPPRQNVHFHDGAILSRDLSFHAAMTELRRLGGPNHELVLSHRKVKVYAKDGRLIAYATPVSDGLTEVDRRHPARQRRRPTPDPE